jgi:cytidylate kinase
MKVDPRGISRSGARPSGARDAGGARGAPQATAGTSEPEAASQPGEAAGLRGALFPKDTRRLEGASAASGPTGIEAVFAKHVGASALAALPSTFSSKPVVLIAGDQLTGKSTAARTVAAALGGLGSGTGGLVREAAAAAGQPVEEFVKQLPARFDVDLDWQATKRIAKGEVAVFESRLAGHLGQMLERLGRKNVVSVYLVASPRERALRYLERELSPAVRARIEPRLHLPPEATLEEALAAVVALGDPEASPIATRMKDIANRDHVDHARLKGLYGVDYQDRSAFDVVIVTDKKAPAEVQREILDAVGAIGSRGGDE